MKVEEPGENNIHNNAFYAEETLPIMHSMHSMLKGDWADDEMVELPKIFLTISCCIVLSKLSFI